MLSRSYRYSALLKFHDLLQSNNQNNINFILNWNQDLRSLQYNRIYYVKDNSISDYDALYPLLLLLYIEPFQQDLGLSVRCNYLFLAYYVYVTTDLLV